MPNPNAYNIRPEDAQGRSQDQKNKESDAPSSSIDEQGVQNTTGGPAKPDATGQPDNVRPIRSGGARGTAAMDPNTRQEVARKGGLAVSRNKEHMASIGRRGGQSVSKNREHMANIGRKGGAASRGSRGSSPTESPRQDESGQGSANQNPQNPIPNVNKETR